MKYKSIVISGPIAAGSSTASKAVADKLGLEYKSAGDFFREYMLKNNIPLYDKEKIPDHLDKKIDLEFSKFTDSKKGYIIDAHYAGYFNRNKKHVLKILLLCDDNVRFKRAMLRKHTHIESIDEIRKREIGLDKKFRKLYADKNFLDPKYFDIVINTAISTIEETAESVIRKFKK